MITTQDWAWALRLTQEKPKGGWRYFYGGGTMGTVWNFGFGGSYDKRSTFANEAGHDAYMAHIRTCKRGHDPRGIRFNKCPDVNPDWFATDSAEDPQP